MKKLLLFALLATSFLFITKAVLAQSTNQSAVSISPVSFDLAGNPGDTITNEVMVRNSGKDPVDISVETQDFVAKGEEGEVTLGERKDSFSLSSWVELDTSKFQLASGKDKKVKFVIRVPYNAEPGGHYASVFAHVSPTTANAQSGSLVGQKIGALVLLRVGGTAKEEASIETFDTTKAVYGNGPILFNLRIQNKGTVHVKPKGVIAITDMFGKKVADITVDQKNVLPGAIRHMQAEWKKTPFFGKFTATVLTYYGAENKQLTAVTSFWVIPVKTLLIWGGIIVIMLVILWLGRKRIKKALKALAVKS